MELLLSLNILDSLLISYLLIEIFLLIPSLLITTLIWYDALFQDGFNPYERMGAVLTDMDKNTFDLARTKQLTTFKQYAVRINILMALIFSSLFISLAFDVDPESLLARIQFRLTYLVLYIIMIFVLLSIASYILKPPGLRSMISVIESKGLTRDLVQHQNQSLSRLDVFWNKDYHILIRSFFKKYYSSNYPTFHDIPYINYSIFRKAKNGIFDAYRIPKMLRDDRSATHYLTRTVLPDLKYTSLWQPNEKLKYLIYLFFIIEIPAFAYLYSLDQSNLSSIIVGLTLSLLPIMLLLLPLRHLYRLNGKDIEKILTENNVEYNSENRYDKIIELVEKEFPYIEL